VWHPGVTTTKQIQYNTVSADNFLLYFFSDMSKDLYCSLYLKSDTITIVLYQKTSTHFFGHFGLFSTKPLEYAKKGVLNIRNPPLKTSQLSKMYLFTNGLLIREKMKNQLV
jgi:hypothetical protein